MSPPLNISDAERRARLVARHHLDGTAPDVVAAVRGVVAMHSSDPTTPYLAVRARVPDFATADLERALVEERTLWRLHAMRRTLFLVPAAEAGVFEAAASRDVARRERKRLEGWLRTEMDGERVPAFLAALEARVAEALADGTERSTRELSAAIPELGHEVTLGSGKWTTRAPISSRVLFLMAMDGRIVRTRAAGSWRSSQYLWAAADGWFGTMPAPMDPEPARVELARRYLAAHGPATLEDLRWWTGWTVKQTAAATAALDTLPVRLDGGGAGLLLADEETAQGPPPSPHVALLPALDPTPMGWKQRDWYLGPHAALLYDRNGNAGPSVWLDGQIVGGWAQRPDGEVVYRLLEDVGAAAERRVAEEAAALTDWFSGTVVKPRFRTPLERELSA
ncbi:MAG: winged helix DNA-binding domain-containing protein [Gemmatimonadota bacterium]